MSKNLELKPISTILNDTFFIPSYQRGYKWDTRQVEDLLEDITDFIKKKKEDEFYCLQPIVLKEENGEYRVIDGQQRLTTVFLILKLFNEIEFKRPKPIYHIEFETRNNSKKYLKNLTLSNEISDTNIDFYYLSKNFKFISNWFDNKLNDNADFIQVLYPILINDVKFIWYEIKDEIEIDVFTRLNIGKIPLTNAELIKALFLLNIKDENEKLLLATQWDEIEYKLQDNKLFSFINSHNFNKPTRIEFIFDLIANEKGKSIIVDNLRKEDEKKSFYIFNELLQDTKTSKYLWDEVKTYFRIFEELYQDNRYYHLIGYLVHNGINIKRIIEKFKLSEKDKFLSTLNNEIKIVLALKKDHLKNLNYHEDYVKVSKVLFLFNVISSMQSDYTRYPFDKHKIERWSLEHIHAQNSEDIKDNKDKVSLLKSELAYVDDSIKEKINQLLEKFDKKYSVSIEEYSNLQNEIFSKYSEDISIHTIDNLALLSREANSALNNSIFPAKRDKIKQLDIGGSFIPIGTKNVFLKYYSSDVKESIHWNRQDRKSYLNAIFDTLTNYWGD